VLQVEYFAGPANLLVSGSDVPVFPSQYHRLLVEGALARAYLDDGNDKWSTMHFDREAKLLAGMVNDLLGPRQQRFSQIVDDWYGPLDRYHGAMAATLRPVPDWPQRSAARLLAE